jgi:branched-chain amino acid transport system substrate-binding protein
LIAPYSGSEYLRDPAQKYVFNIKAGYPDQVETLVKLAVNSLGLKEVCAFYQDDALGRTGIDAAEKALKAQGLKLHAKASYKRNSMEIEPALNVLKGAGCKALLMASQDRQSAVFVAKANAAGFHPQFFCLNLIGTGEFLNRVKDLNEKIYVSIVTPLPTETAYPIVKEFRKEVTTLNPSAKITANTLEGYLVGAVFEDVLRRSGKALTRIAFSAAFENLKDANIGGITFTFDKSNRQATNKVFLTRVENGELAFLP